MYIVKEYKQGSFLGHKSFLIEEDSIEYANMCLRQEKGIEVIVVLLDYDDCENLVEQIIYKIKREE